MNEFRVTDESTDPDSHENQVPNGSSIRSTAWRDPTMNRTNANPRRYLLLGTHEPRERELALRNLDVASVVRL